MLSTNRAYMPCQLVPEKNEMKIKNERETGVKPAASGRGRGAEERQAVTRKDE
ncbi:hypothetical protein LZ30DRAFT_696495 [Colletotrichum cereale]|nr:hypothetical protein LZ30DRAFT_696495 [Colletotrichum cereale]